MCGFRLSLLGTFPISGSHTSQPGFITLLVDVQLSGWERRRALMLSKRSHADINLYTAAFMLLYMGCHVLT